MSADSPNKLDTKRACDALDEIETYNTTLPKIWVLERLQGAVRAETVEDFLREADAAFMLWLCKDHGGEERARIMDTLNAIGRRLASAQRGTT